MDRDVVHSVEIRDVSGELVISGVVELDDDPVLLAYFDEHGLVEEDSEGAVVRGVLHVLGS